MRTAELGRSGITTTRLIYGCMRTVGTWNPADVDEERVEMARTAVLAAFEAGYRHFDHADIYCRGECERVFGRILAENPGMREQIIITTKCGIRWPGVPDAGSPHRYDFSATHILWSAEQSLERLGVETIDVYLLHRPDVLMDPDEVAGAFQALKQAGKVRAFGVSNFTPAQFDALQAAWPEPLACNQLRITPQDVRPFEDGTLEHHLRVGTTPTAYSPVAGGILGDGAVVPADHADCARLTALNAALDAEAAQLGVSRSAAVNAWLMRHPAGIQPIIGTVNPERIRSAAAADGVEMGREAWYRIYLAARGRPLP